MELIEKKISGKEIYKGKIITVEVDEVLLPNDNTSVREVVKHPGGVCVAAIDQNNNLFFVEQFRYPHGETVVELPAGKLEWGESPLPAAIRELKEETGCVAKHIKQVAVSYPTPGFCSEKLYLFVAHDLEYGEQNLDSDEFLSVKKIHIDKAVEMVLDGTFKDGKTQTLVLIAEKLIKNNTL